MTISRLVRVAALVAALAFVGGLQAAVPPREVGKVVSLGNFTASGSIGSAALVTDVRAIVMAQTTAGLTFTLPNPSDTSVIGGLDVLNTGSASFGMYGVTVTAGSDLRLGWTGSAWVPDVGALPSGTATLSTSSFSATLPGGAILKGGTLSVSSGTGSLTFPTAFPTACVAVTATYYNASATTTSSYSVTVKSYSASSFSVDASSLGGSTLAITAATGTVLWQAVGY